MRRILIFLSLVLLLITGCQKARHTFPKSYSLGRTEKVAKVNQWSKVIYDEIAISRRGKYVGVSSFDGNFYLFDEKGSLVLKYKIPEGLGRRVGFYKDKIFLAGEVSPDGCLYAFDTRSGRLRWKYCVAKDLGKINISGAHKYSWSSQPQIQTLVVGEGVVYFVGCDKRRVIKKIENKEIPTYPIRTVVYAVEVNSGKVLWKYPKKEVMDTRVPKLVLSKDGNYLVFVNSSWTRGLEVEKYPDGTLRILDTKRGVEIDKYRIKPNKPFFTYVGVWGGVGISDDNKYICVFTSDGRGILFSFKNNRLERLWNKDISTPLEVTGIPIHATGSWCNFYQDKVIFITGQTYISDKSKSATSPEVVHPNSTSIFLYNLKGDLRWKYSLDGSINSEYLKGEYLVLAVGHNYIKRKKGSSGVYVFKFEEQKLKFKFFHQLKGIGISSSISSEGKFLSTVEAPIMMENNKVEGKHRVWFIKR